MIGEQELILGQSVQMNILRQLHHLVHLVVEVLLLVLLHPVEAQAVVHHRLEVVAVVVLRLQV